MEKVQVHLKKNTGKNKEVDGRKWNETKVTVLAPLLRGRKGEHYQMLYDLLGKGFGEVRVDGVVKSLRDRIDLSKNKKHEIDVVVDTLALHEFKDDKEGSRMRLSEAVERALTESDGLVTIFFRNRRRIYPLREICV